MEELTTLKRHEEPLTVKRYNEIKTVETLNIIVDTLTKENSDLKKSKSEDKIIISSQAAQVSNQQVEMNRLRRDMDAKNEKMQDDKYTISALRGDASKVPQLEREVNELTRRNQRSEEEVKKLTKEKSELQDALDEYENQDENIDDEENEDDNHDEENENTEDETETLTNNYNMKTKQLYGGIMNDNSHEQYEMPEDPSETITKAALKLLDDGNISLKTIEALQEVKKQLGGHVISQLNSQMTEVEKTEQLINDLLKQYKGRIPEDEIKKLTNLYYDHSGWRIEAGITQGKNILKKNFYSRTYSKKID